FDLLGVALSAVGLFLLVFGIQEGQRYDWGTITGPISVWSLIIAGLVVLAGFVYWQARNPGEPLISLTLFRDRNFSLANVAITTVGFAVTSQGFPLILYAQTVRGMTPTQSALLLAPLAILSGVLAPFTGRLTDRVHPRWIAGFGMSTFVVGLFWLSQVMTADAPVWHLLLPIALIGVSNSCVWAPISTSATRNLPMDQAGGGSGVYNTTRQVGAVLGSAAIAVAMESRLAALMPAGTTGGSLEPGTGGALPPVARDAFAAAMAQALLLPAAVLVVGFVAVVFFATPRHLLARREPDRRETAAVAE
ncbi:MAG: MFS transporter, partial [Pseudonocardia sediminis]